MELDFLVANQKLHNSIKPWIPSYFSLMVFHKEKISMRERKVLFWDLFVRYDYWSLDEDVWSLPNLFSPNFIAALLLNIGQYWFDNDATVAGKHLQKEQDNLVLMHVYKPRLNPFNWKRKYLDKEIGNFQWWFTRFKFYSIKIKKIDMILYIY